MGTFLGSAVFSAAVFFYCLGIIFTVVGYIGAWLEIRDDFKETVTSIGVRKACFNHKVIVDNRFATSSDPLNGCYDSTANSKVLSELPQENYGPDWYRMVQDMHLASLILLFLALILVIGFLIAYCILKQQVKKRHRPSSCLLLSKGGLGLWFILTIAAGALQIVEPTIFWRNYRNNNTFFDTPFERTKYGPGFAITIAAGVCLLISSIFGIIVFAGVIRKMYRLSSGDAKMVFTDEFDNLDPQDTEMERLSQDEVDSGAENSTVTHKKAYPVAAPRRPQSTYDKEEQSYQNIPKSRNQSEDPPAGQAYQNIPTPRPKAVPQPAKRLSTHGKPVSGYLPNYDQQQPAAMEGVGGRSLAGESMASTAYPPSTHYSNYSPHLQRRDANSDTDSQRSGARNKSVTRSGVAEPRRTDIPAPVVVPAGRSPDVKHSRYAAAF